MLMMMTTTKTSLLWWPMCECWKSALSLTIKPLLFFPPLPTLLLFTFPSPPLSHSFKVTHTHTHTLTPTLSFFSLFFGKNPNSKWCSACMCMSVCVCVRVCEFFHLKRSANERVTKLAREHTTTTTSRTHLNRLHRYEGGFEKFGVGWCGRGR